MGHFGGARFGETIIPSIRDWHRLFLCLLILTDADDHVVSRLKQTIFKCDSVCESDCTKQGGNTFSEMPPGTWQVTACSCVKRRIISA